MNRRNQHHRGNKGQRSFLKFAEYNQEPTQNSSTHVPNDTNTVTKQEKSSSVIKTLLFPGEEYDFNEKLIHYNAFGYHSGKLISKRCGVLLYSRDGKGVDENTDEIYRSLGRYYSPKVDDIVIGTIVQKSSEFYKVDINTYTYAILNTKDFEGATKKTKPNLHIGDIVFARVLKVNKFDSPTLSCVSQTSTKTWASGESYFGGLKGGCVFNFPKIFSWDLYKGGYVIKRLEDYVQFEICVGANGRMWINSDSTENILAINEVIINSFSKSQKEIEQVIHDKFINQMKIDK